MSSGTGLPTGMPSGTANGSASGPASQGTSTAAAETSPATPAANAQAATPEARPVPTYDQLLALLTATRTRRISAEQEAARLRTANAHLDQQLQAHSQATALATESIARLNEQVQALTRVNSTVTNQLIATQRELIDLQQELTVELRERLRVYQGGDESEDGDNGQ